MHDIKIPDHGGKKGDFEVTRLTGEGNREIHVEEKPHPVTTDKVKVNFEKFVQLIATHDFGEVMKKHADEDVIINTNLLADLASAHQEHEDTTSKKILIFVIVGILIGVIATYIIVRL